MESSEFNEVVQIDHQKICMNDSRYNQILVIIDHFKKLEEVVPCQTASAEVTCDHSIKHWISRYGCAMTFQSDNGKTFVVDLTKELMRFHPAQAHSTTSQKNLGMPMEIKLNSKIVRETLKAKSYDLDEVETGKVTVGTDLRKLLDERLADDKPEVPESGKDKPEVAISNRGN